MKILSLVLIALLIISCDSSSDFEKILKTKDNNMEIELEGEAERELEEGVEEEIIRTVKASKVVFRNEIAYEVNSQVPFTGRTIGNKAQTHLYLNGKKHGKQFEYHRNGQNSREYNYLNGKQHGKQISYNKNGQIMWERNYLNGKQIFQK